MLGSHPATFQDNHRLLDPERETHRFLEIDLKTPKLNVLHSSLWLAGLPRPARPLHRQRRLFRTIYLTELPDEHMVWDKNAMFVKPCPPYLLDHDHWQKSLCPDESLFRSACGLLLSYVWLVSYPSDFRIAKETGVIPDAVTWEAWTALARDLLRRLESGRLQIDRRYRYGELRLSRLDLLYRVNPSRFSVHSLVYGFMPGSTWSADFFGRNFGWILAVFIYVTVVLSALQVGLATERLQGSVAFQGLSYGLALTSIAVVLAAVALMDRRRNDPRSAE
ncbi:hypothetical protein CONLIGDRAFT_655892 [Coniochaeta ligniaria NRRL 30616]|uniref:Uncharacterized protein n=1 Tax=Coniochaeta ligniaria NRRL 30616 TaxID=1408157 RepID=A0A1J7IZB2_9PEZI|nr:hypothetical protein CONLIGDRAFT_655892 [Coniochaeta ligniaria NRRL 30616]